MNKGVDKTQPTANVDASDFQSGRGVVGAIGKRVISKENIKC